MSVEQIGQEKEIPSSSNFVNVVTHPLEPVSDTRLLTLGAEAEEKIVHLSTENIEKPEREGRLPKAYASLSLSEVKTIVAGGELADEGKPESDRQLEIERLIETVELLRESEEIWPRVFTKEDIVNPLGELSEATLLLTSDLHHAPSWSKEGTRAYAFKRYGWQRAVLDALEPIKSRVRLRKVGQNSLDRRYIEREDGLHLFNQWLVALVSKEAFRQEDDDKSKPILIDLGDLVHDGAFFIDQLSVSRKALGVVEEIKLRSSKDTIGNPTVQPALLRIIGNHDEDSRIQESVSMLTELFGFRVFAQKVGGVLVAAVDTNIENPEWLRIFKERADSAGEEILAKKREMQDVVLEQVRSFNGDVVLLGHHPSRMIDAYQDTILKNSNVKMIVGGHSHRESHSLSPITNKKGERVQVHVLESVIKHERGTLVPPKVYGLKIGGGEIGEVTTMSEGKERLKSRHKQLIEGTSVGRVLKLTPK